MAANVAAALSYVLVLLTGIIFYALEKESTFVRFHAMQSILFCVAWLIGGVVLGAIPLLWFLSPLWTLAGLALWVVLIVKAYQGERWGLPYLGELAERYSGLPS